MHSLSSPTSSPYSHTNADKALRGESASSRRFAVSFLPPEAPSQAALLPPISFPLGHSSFLRPPVCSVNGSGDCSAIVPGIAPLTNQSAALLTVPSMDPSIAPSISPSRVYAGALVVSLSSRLLIHAPRALCVTSSLLTHA